MSSKSPIINSRRELLIAIDYKNTNPQGGPDEDNAPRTDPETGRGIVTSFGLKRKIRDMFALTQPIYIARGSCMETTHRLAAESVGHPEIFDPKAAEEAAKAEETASVEGEESEETTAKSVKGKGKSNKKVTKRGKATPESSRLVYEALAVKYLDFRLFGGTLPGLIGTGRGPVQISMGESVDPVTPLRLTITRAASATEKDQEEQSGAGRGMGGLHYIPYGLYVFHAYINPNDAKRTGMTEADYDLFLKTLEACFENDRSSTRSTGCLRALYEFRHGKEPADKAISGERLLESIRIVRKDSDTPARSFDDYKVSIPRAHYGNPDFQFIEHVKSVNWDYSEVSTEAAE